MKYAVNFIGFQLAWFAGVLGAANGLSWVGPAVLALWAILHFSLSAYRRQDLYILLFAVIAGTLIDSGFRLAGIIEYQGFAPAAHWAPLWISGMWAGFALTINHSLRWLHGRVYLAILFGAIGGPASYWAGMRLGAVEILAPHWGGLLVIGSVWAIATPLLMQLGRLLVIRASHHALPALNPDQNTRTHKS